MSRKKLTVSLDEEIIKAIEERRTKKNGLTITEDKSHFVEKILVIGLEVYDRNFETLNKLNLLNINISKLKFN